MVASAPRRCRSARPWMRRPDGRADRGHELRTRAPGVRRLTRRDRLTPVPAGSDQLDSPGGPGASTAARPIIEAEHVSKNFGHVRALSDVSFNLRAGEVHALVGDN